MAQLSSNGYGVREIPLRGAPLSREEWLKRNDGHDLRIIELDDVSIQLIDEMVDVDEMEDVVDAKGVMTGRQATGRTVSQPSGRKIEQRGESRTSLTLLIDLTTNTIGVDHEPVSALPAPPRPAWLPDEFDSPEAMAEAYAVQKTASESALTASQVRPSWLPAEFASPEAMADAYAAKVNNDKNRGTDRK